MGPRPLVGARAWAGYTIGLEEGAGGWRYRLRRDLLPGEAYRASGQVHTGGPFASEEAGESGMPVAEAALRPRSAWAGGRRQEGEA